MMNMSCGYKGTIIGSVLVICSIIDILFASRVADIIFNLVVVTIGLSFVLKNQQKSQKKILCISVLVGILIKMYIIIFVLPPITDYRIIFGTFGLYVAYTGLSEKISTILLMAIWLMQLLLRKKAVRLSVMSSITIVAVNVVLTLCGILRYGLLLNSSGLLGILTPIIIFAAFFVDTYSFKKKLKLSKRMSIKEQLEYIKAEFEKGSLSKDEYDNLRADILSNV